jgi:hypothetical protein
VAWTQATAQRSALPLVDNRPGRGPDALAALFPPRPQGGIVSGTPAQRALDASAPIQCVLTAHDLEIKQRVKEFIDAGQIKHAVLWLWGAYGYSVDYPMVTIGEPVSGLKAPWGEEVFGQTAGVIEKNEKQTITFDREKFTAKATSAHEADWTYLVSALGHEGEHAAHRSGADPRSGNRPVDDRNEAEFLSYSWEAFGLSHGPPLSLEQRHLKANEAIKHWNALVEDVRAKAIKLSPDLLASYFEQAKDLDKIRKKFTAQKEAEERKKKIEQQTQLEIQQGLRFPNGKLKSYGTFS